jgi:hypothetical protein
LARTAERGLLDDDFRGNGDATRIAIATESPINYSNLAVYGR